VGALFDVEKGRAYAALFGKYVALVLDDHLDRCLKLADRGIVVCVFVVDYHLLLLLTVDGYGDGALGGVFGYVNDLDAAVALLARGAGSVTHRGRYGRACADVVNAAVVIDLDKHSGKNSYALDLELAVADSLTLGGDKL
jgi:hypothetical protein